MNTNAAGRAPALPPDAPADADLLVVSFGYNHGPAPEGATLVLDVRRLIAGYGLGTGEETGRDRQVRDRLLALPNMPRMLAHLTDLARDLLLTADRDTFPVVIAIGSAKGLHRSVVLADQLAEAVRLNGGYDETYALHLALPPVAGPDRPEGE
jgi:RNase adaptor protein for sRNA GlmZ degradation